ncbi:MAG: LysM peptidoglycan-binding domain-containing protein, partial [Candidatus Sericytochromatia bacterium]|nr:LysM peptidoglycan-binding domain-containing protein [Candidatus Tanganyikabacteria bacterium]
MSTAMLRQTAKPPRAVRLAVTPGGPSPNERPGRGPAFAYTVRQGDTLYALARACGVPMAELMRRNPALHGSSLKVGERIWIPDLLPASAGEPAEGLAYRAAHGGEVRMSADRRFVAVLDCTLAGHANSLTAYERKSGKKIPVPGTASDQCWKRVGWSPDGRLLAIEGLRKANEEGGTFIAFDPLTGEKSV